MTIEQLRRDVACLSVGKTIAEIEADCLERVTITFTDGTQMVLSAHRGPHLDVYCTVADGPVQSTNERQVMQQVLAAGRTFGYGRCMQALAFAWAPF